MFMVRHDFLETFDIEVVAGRGFSKDFPSDTLNAIMINETMVKNLGWTNEEAIGKRIASDGEERVIGIFKDFNILSLHNPINNFVLDMLRNPNAANGLTTYIAVRVNTSDYSNILTFMESKWKDIAENRPFEYSFLDEELNQLYNDEEKFSKFSIMLTVLAMVIAGLGLYGLTSYLAEQRTKEIGIRRVMGASTFNIVRLLSNEFLILIVLANILAWPAAYIFTRNWLQNFAERTSVNWLYFIYSGLATLLMALLITGIKAFNASRKNPAYTLRYE
jgi:putative ABC transport system permease protein